MEERAKIEVPNVDRFRFNCVLRLTRGAAENCSQGAEYWTRAGRLPRCDHARRRFRSLRAMALLRGCSIPKGRRKKRRTMLAEINYAKALLDEMNIGG
jgi:hypothetical protein